MRPTSSTPLSVHTGTAILLHSTPHNLSLPGNQWTGRGSGQDTRTFMNWENICVGGRGAKTEVEVRSRNELSLSDPAGFRG